MARRRKASQPRHIISNEATSAAIERPANTQTMLSAFFSSIHAQEDDDVDNVVDTSTSNRKEVVTTGDTASEECVNDKQKSVASSRVNVEAFEKKKRSNTKVQHGRVNKRSRTTTDAGEKLKKGAKSRSRARRAFERGVQRMEDSKHGFHYNSSWERKGKTWKDKGKTSKNATRIMRRESGKAHDRNLEPKIPGKRKKEARIKRKNKLETFYVKPAIRKENAAELRTMGLDPSLWAAKYWNPNRMLKKEKYKMEVSDAARIAEQGNNVPPPSQAYQPAQEEPQIHNGQATDAVPETGTVMQYIETPSTPQGNRRFFGPQQWPPTPSSMSPSSTSSTSTLLASSPPPKADEDAYMEWCIRNDRMPTQSPPSSEKSVPELGNYADPEGSELEYAEPLGPFNNYDEDDGDDRVIVSEPSARARIYEDWDSTWRCRTHDWEVTRINDDWARCGIPCGEACKIDLRKVMNGKHFHVYSDMRYAEENISYTDSKSPSVVSIASDYESDDDIGDAAMHTWSTSQEDVDVTVHANVRCFTTKDYQVVCKEKDFDSGSIHAMAGRVFDGHESIWRRTLPVEGSQRYENRPDDGRNLIVLDRIEALKARERSRAGGTNGEHDKYAV